MDNLPPGFIIDQPVVPQSSELPPGFQLDEEKYGTIPEQAKTALESGASGATLGLSKIAETKLLGVKPEDIAGREEANPVTAGVSNIAGNVGLAAATGGGSAVAKGTGLGAKVLAGGIEGTALGAQNVAEDYAIGDPNLNAQKVIANLGIGAAFGGGLGALSKGFEVALPAVTQKLNDSISSLKEAAFGTKEAPGFLGATGREILDGWHGQGLEENQDNIRAFSKNMGDMVDAGRKSANKLYDEYMPVSINRALNGMDVNTAKEGVGMILEPVSAEVKNIVENPEEFTPAIRKQVNNAWNTVNYDIGKSETAPEAYLKLAQFAKDTAKIVKMDVLPTSSQQAARDAMGRIQTQIRTGLRDPTVWGQEATDIFNSVSDRYSSWKTALSNIQKDLMKKEVSPTGFSKYVMDPADAKSLFNKYNDVSQDLRKAHLSSLIDEAKNIASVSESHLAGQEGEKSISQKLTELEKQHGELRDVAQAMQKRVKGESLIGLPALGAVGFAVAHHPVVAATIAGVKLASKFSNPYELGATLGKSYNTIKTIGSLVNKTSKAINSGTKGVFSTGARLSTISVPTNMSTQEYNKTTQRISELANNPDTLGNHLTDQTNNMYEAAPNVSQGIHSSTIAALQFLNSKIPRPPNQLIGSDEWEPNNDQKQLFNEYYNAVNDPISLLNNIKDGSLSHPALEAVQAVYPHLLQEMRQNLISNTTPDKLRTLNYSAKMAMAKFLGQPLDENMTPASIMSNQMAIQGPKANIQPGGQGKSTVGGMKELDLAKRTATNVHDLEEET